MQSREEETRILDQDASHRYKALDHFPKHVDHMTKEGNIQKSEEDGEEDDDGVELDSNRMPPCEKYCKTIALCSLMFGMGLMHAIFGPTLLDLAYGLSVSLSQVSLIFMGQAIGFIVGVALGGMTADHVNHWFFMSILLLFAALLTMAVPFWTSLPLLVISTVPRGACMRALELVTNIALLDIWGKESSSPMQQLHFTVAVGCGVVPLLVKPFSGEKVEIGPTAAPMSMESESKRSLNDSDVVPLLFPAGVHPPSVPSLSALGNSTSTRVILENSHVEWVYLIVGIVNLAIGMYLLVIYFCFPYRKSKSQCEQNNRGALSDEDRSRERAFRYRFVPVGVLLLALYFGVLLAYDGYLVTYAVISDLKMTVSEATTLAATFWLTFAFGRFLAIFYSMFFTDYVIMHADMFCLLLSAIPLSTSASSNKTAFYICSILFALSFSSLGPAALSYTSRYLTINGKIGAIYMVGGSLGEIFLPVIIAYMMDHYSPMWLMYIVTMCTLSLFPLAQVKFYLARKHGEKME